MALSVNTSVTQLDENLYSLVVESFDEATIGFLNEQGLEGNGYSWAGIVHSIAKSELSSRVSDLSWSPEADSLLVTSSDLSLLETLEKAVRQCLADESRVSAAIENADPEMLD